jgi:hypothetical protein
MNKQERAVPEYEKVMELRDQAKRISALADAIAMHDPVPGRLLDVLKDQADVLARAVTLVLAERAKQ